MKIHATHEEICQMLSRAVGSPVESFSIRKGDNKLVNQCKAAVESVDYKGNGKIAAIKALRAVFPIHGDQFRTSSLGLAEAKYAVENWEKWIAFVKKNNRIPVEGYLYNGELK